MSADRWQPPRPTRQPALDGITATRELFALVLGLAGLLVGVVFAYSLRGGELAAAARWAAWAVPASGAITAMLAYELGAALGRTRRAALILLRLALLGLNGVLFVAELLVLVSVELVRRGGG